MEVTRECFFKGCAQAVPGNRIFHISQAVQQHAEENGYSVVRELVGHGIGQQMHEDPDIPNFVSRRKGSTLRPGMALAIEPMINLGVKEVCFLDDGWTTVTADGKPSAHYENTIMVTDGEPEILTLER